MISFWQMMAIAGILIFLALPILVYLFMLIQYSGGRVYYLYTHPTLGRKITSSRPRALAFFYPAVWPLFYSRLKLWLLTLVAATAIFIIISAGAGKISHSLMMDNARVQMGQETSYLERLREANPSLNSYSDAEVIDSLPELLPERFGRLSPDEVLSEATLTGYDLYSYRLKKESIDASVKAEAFGILAGSILTLVFVGYYMARKSPAIVQERLEARGYELQQSGSFKTKDAAVAAWAAVLKNPADGGG